MGHNAPLDEQFWKHVHMGAPTACWPWSASRRPTGYGQMRRLGKNLKAHRVSWELHNGPIPDGMVVRHACDNPPCVNPAHLLLGTVADNMRDMSERARGNGGRFTGESNAASKLTADRVIELRNRAAGGESMRSLARDFGLNKKTVAGIIRRETWRHV